MNPFVPDGYLTLEGALEHFGQLKHADKWEAEKASSKRTFQQFLFAETLSAKLFTPGGKLLSLESSIWGGIEAERIFETGRASKSVGDEYFPDAVDGPVLIEQLSIDALCDVETSSAQEASMPRHQYRTHLLEVLEEIWSDIDKSDWRTKPPTRASIEADLKSRSELSTRERTIIATMFIPDNRRGKTKKG